MLKVYVQTSSCVPSSISNRCDSKVFLRDDLMFQFQSQAKSARVCFPPNALFPEDLNACFMFHVRNESGDNVKEMRIGFGGLPAERMSEESGGGARSGSRQRSQST